MFKIVKRLALATVMTALAANGAFAGTIPESQDPIKVIKNDWTGQLFSTEVLGRMLQKMGYNIEYVSAGALPQHPGIAQVISMSKPRYGPIMLATSILT